MFDFKNIKPYARLVLLKIRYFMLSQRCREYLIFLFFTLVSFGFWALQTLDEVFQTDFRIPIRLKNVPKDIVLTAEFPEDIQVQVEDRGTVLLNYMLGRTFFPVTFDFQDYQEKGPRVIIPTNELQKRISSQLNVSTRILSIRPDTLEFIYTRAKGKKIPVRMNGKIQPGRQYYISHFRFSPDSVMVYAPEEVLKTLDHAYIAELDLDDVTDTLSQKVSFVPVKGAKFVPPVVDLSIFVDMYSEKTVEVPVTGTDFPAGKVLRTFPSKVQVSFQVGLKRFKDVSARDFQISVSYHDIMHNKGDKLPLKLTRMPGFVDHVRIAPSEVDYLIEQQSEND